MEAREEIFSPEELLAADEAFLTGTTRAIQPIAMVDDVQMSRGEAGPVTRLLMDAFQRAEDQFVARMGS